MTGPPPSARPGTGAGRNPAFAQRNQHATRRCADAGVRAATSDDNRSLMPTSYGLLSTYPPTQCGLATFTAALLTHLPEPGDQVSVVRVLDEPAPRPADEVVHDLVADSVANASAAAEVLNSFDVVIVQHEYGIYGGPDGPDVLALRYAWYVPTIGVLHTVLARPTSRQRAILDEVIAAASMVVTMTQTARSRLLDLYGTTPDKVVVIPHGAADHRGAVAPTVITGRPKVLTWGLLGPGKGIEHAIDSLALLSGYGLDIDYLVVGQTHPRVLARDGEAHRASLPARAGAGRRARALRRPVPARGRTGPADQRRRCRTAAVRLAGAGHLRGPDRGGHRGQAGGVDVLPPCRRTSRRGPAGRTAGPGRHRRRAAPGADRTRLGGADEQLLGGRGPAHAVARGGACVPETRRRDHHDQGRNLTVSNRAVPFRHLLRMTDHIGLLEHAEGIVPRHEHGYCVDDVARGLVVVCREPSPAQELITLGRRYLHFLAQAQAPDGKVHNRLGYDRRWHDRPGTEDCWGRCLWGLGTAAAQGPTAGIREESLTGFDRCAQVSSPWPHAMAFGALGAAEILQKWPDHAGALTLLDGAATAIGAPPADPQWPWPEPRLSYANAAIAEALIVAGDKLGRDQVLHDGLRMVGGRP